MSTHLPIGVFDSGVGGLTVVRALRQRLPDQDILYVADSAHAPYGAKPPGYVRERATTVTDFLVAQGAAAIVVACNTATAMAVEHLRQRHAVPIVAMEPAVKPAAAATRSGVIGVLATAGTLESARYRALLRAHGSRVQVLERVCHRWVEIVERGDLDTAEARRLVADEIAPLLDAGADTLVLGCTHFPFLAPLIREAAGPAVGLVDPAPAVAEQLARCLPAAGPGDGTLRLWSSRCSQDEASRLGRFLERPVSVAPLT